MRRRHVHGLSDLFIDDDINLDALLSLALQESVQSILLIVFARAPQIKFGRKPPIQYEDGLTGPVNHLRQSPQVVVPVNMPFDKVLRSLHGETAESMAFVNLRSNLIVLLLFRVIVTI